MDAPDLSLNLHAAGSEYLNALDRLGLKPDGLAWVYDFKMENFALWLIWAGVEKIGPYQVNKKLFQAYNLSALPKAIDPFSVFVFSPSMPLAKWLKDQYKAKNESDFQAAQLGSRIGTGDVTATFETRPEWMYRVAKKTQPVSVSKNWRRFSSAVDALAA